MYYVEESEVSEYDKHRTYKIRKGDTLQSVARELGVDAQDLRRHHNIYCRIPDLIEADFKSHLELLILPPEKKEDKTNDETEKKRRKVSFGDDNRLYFSPERTNENYKVQYTSEVGDEVDVTEMNINVKWLAVDKNKYHLFEINRASDIYINGKVPDTKMSELAVKTAEVLYPLEIVVDEFGKWVAVYNHNEIESRWGEIRSEILDYYEGEVAETYIKHIDYALESADTLFELLASDYFLRAFFNGIHVAYTTNYSFENELTFPLEKNKESVFKAEQKVASHLDEEGLIKVEQKGDYIDSGFEINLGHAPRKGNYSAAYFLDADSYYIEKMNLECDINYDNPIKIAIKIDRIKKQVNLDND